MSTTKKQNIPLKISLCFQVNSIIDKVQVVEPEWLAKTLDDQHQMEMSKWKINTLVYFIVLLKPIFSDTLSTILKPNYFKKQCFFVIIFFTY